MSYQCVVLAGRDEPSRLNDLTSEYPKSCLTVVYKPFLVNVVDTIFKELPECKVLIVVTQKGEAAVKNILTGYLSPNGNIESCITTVVVPSTDRGFLDCLPFIIPHITTSDVFFIPGEVYGPLPLKSLYELHLCKKRPLSHTLSLLLLKNEPNRPVKKKENQPTKFSENVIVARDGPYVLAIKNSSDLYIGLEKLQIPLTNLINRDNNISIDSFFTDIHVYLMDAPLLDVINALGLKHNLDSFRLDILPFITAMQSGLTQFCLPSLTVLCLPWTPPNNLTSAASLCRIRTAEEYRRLNMLELQSSDFKQLVVSSTNNNSVTNSYISPGCSVDQNTAIKNSCIGNGCTIKGNCRITGSVLLHDVTVHERVTISNSVISNGAVILENSKLANCVVQSAAIVAPGDYKNQTFYGSTENFIL